MIRVTELIVEGRKDWFGKQEADVSRFTRQSYMNWGNLSGKHCLLMVMSPCDLWMSACSRPIQLPQNTFFVTGDGIPYFGTAGATSSHRELRIPYSGSQIRLPFPVAASRGGR